MQIDMNAQSELMASFEFQFEWSTQFNIDLCEHNIYTQKHDLLNC